MRREPTGAAVSAGRRGGVGAAILVACCVAQLLDVPGPLPAGFTQWHGTSM